jgi:hypothetical protein
MLESLCPEYKFWGYEDVLEEQRHQLCLRVNSDVDRKLSVPVERMINSLTI